MLENRKQKLRFNGFPDTLCAVGIDSLGMELPASQIANG
jgi:hypothetical protein